jgi:hypothetical protein
LIVSAIGGAFALSKERVDYMLAQQACQENNSTCLPQFFVLCLLRSE